MINKNKNIRGQNGIDELINILMIKNIVETLRLMKINGLIQVLGSI